MAHNLEQARRRAQGRPVWAVIKANAYGHGIENAVRGFAQADGLAMLELDEAQRARAAGWSGPILLIEGVFEPEDLCRVRELDLTIVVHSTEQLDWLERAADGPPIAVYLKIDTGMNRLGFPLPRALDALDRLSALPQVRLAALMTHLANADQAVDGAPDVAGQRQTLQRLVPSWGGAWSVSNSAALFLHPHLGAEWVRPGIALYGASPATGIRATELGLIPAMSLQARLLTIRELAVGDSVGYGSLWRARRRSRIGVVSCGYADGYPRQTPEGVPVWVGRQSAPLVGRVSMDMLTVDLTEVPDAQVGMQVELWGRHVSVDELAQRAGTVGYELLAGLPARVRESAAVDDGAT